MCKSYEDLRIKLYSRNSVNFIKLSYINLLLFVDDANNFIAIFKIQRSTHIQTYVRLCTLVSLDNARVKNM